MRQPSLYAYFDSKLALYDAMFADGNRQLLERLAARKLPAEPRAALKAFMRAFVDFALERRRAVRVAVPAAHPRLRAVAGVVRARRGDVRTRLGELLAAAGMTDQADVDCFVAMVARAHRRAVQQRPGRRPLDPAPRPTRRPVPATTPNTKEEEEPMSDLPSPAHPTPRGQGDRRGGVPALRRPHRVAHRRRVGTADRLHRVGRAQGRAARARLGRRAGVVPAVRPSARPRRAAEQGRSTRTTGSTA